MIRNQHMGIAVSDYREFRPALGLTVRAGSRVMGILSPFQSETLRRRQALIAMLDSMPPPTQTQDG